MKRFISILIFLRCLLLVTSVSSQESQNVFPTSNIGNITGVSAQCASDTETWQTSLKLAAQVSVECLPSKKCTAKEKKIIEDNFYAVQQYDAWGKIPITGIFQVPILFDGSYQECERVSGRKYKTNYCYMTIFPGHNVSCNMKNGLPTSIFFREAVCMPDSCSEQDLPAVYNQISKLPFTACQAFCSSYPVKKTSAFWGFTSFMAVTIAIALSATFIDYIRDSLKKDGEKRTDGRALQVLMAFSLWTNAELILSVKEQKQGFIKCLDCIRFLSMLWVVTGHMFSILTLTDQVLSIIDFTKKFWNHFILNAFYSVDTFFLLSGIVVAYLFFKTRLKMSQITSPVTWILFYVHRYLRLTPPIMIFIGFFVVYGYYIQGPGVASILNIMNYEVDICVDYWWANLLYINNLIPAKNQCYGISWYLEADTQMYLLAPVFLVGLYFSFAIGAALITAAIIGSVITVYILYSIYDLPADNFGNGDRADFYKILYEKPWVRCTPYLCGLFVGYILAIYGKRKVRLNWAIAIAGWLIAFSLAVLCLFATYDYDKRYHWSIFSRATYYNFSRLAWSLAVSWVIVANHMGWGGPIATFMSHPIWQPFGRLSYSAYIVHYMVLYVYLSIGDASAHYYSNFQIFIYYAVPTTLMSYFVAFFWSCLFEIPILKLEKMLIQAIVGSGASDSGKVRDVEKKEPEIETEPSTAELWNADVKDVEEDSIENVQRF